MPDQSPNRPLLFSHFASGLLLKAGPKFGPRQRHGRLPPVSNYNLKSCKAPGVRRSRTTSALNETGLLKCSTGSQWCAETERAGPKWPNWYPEWKRSHPFAFDVFVEGSERITNLRCGSTAIRCGANWIISPVRRKAAKPTELPLQTLHSGKRLQHRR